MLMVLFCASDIQVVSGFCGSVTVAKSTLDVFEDTESAVFKYSEVFGVSVSSEAIASFDVLEAGVS